MEKLKSIIRDSRERIAESELVLNPDGSVYHIKLLPEHVKENVIVVGDQHRVEQVSRLFDNIEAKVSNREFVCHVGSYKGTEFTVLSTGIGTDNIDIVLNELDAAINIDLETRTVKENIRSLNIVRIGTSGSLQEDIAVDSFVCSSYGLGLDGLVHCYEFQPTTEAQSLTEAFKQQTNWKSTLSEPYFIKASDGLLQLLSEEAHTGITATATGFYGPQGRMLRLNVATPDINELLTSFSYAEYRITNFEMETSALYGLGQMLGHKTCTVCAIIANRIQKQYSKDYQKAVNNLIEYVLERMK